MTLRQTLEPRAHDSSQPARGIPTVRDREKWHPTALISDQATVGSRVSIGPYTLVHPAVHIALDGDPGSPAECRIGRQARVRSHSVVYSGVVIGDRFQSGHRITLREGTHIGRGVKVGTLCDLQGNLTIGDYTRLHSNVHVGMYSV